jgi:REP element-mobilizing transposase RayT
MAQSGEPIVAWHFIFCTYGFWLPNDPRGSWSRFVRSAHIMAVGGLATGGGNIRRSVAGVPHDRARRNAAREALHYPPVKFSGIQARAVARGFARAVGENQYHLYACSIMPDHVHILMAVQPCGASRVVGHLRARATQQINVEGINPMSVYSTPTGKTPPIWAAGHWCVYIHPSEMDGVRRYIELNPVKAGLRRQSWSFVAPNPP